MLNIFNNNKPFILFFVPLIALLVCMPLFLKPVFIDPVHPMPLYLLIDTGLQYAVLKHILLFLVLILNALLLNYVVNKHDLLLRNTNLVASVFLFMAAFIPNALTLNPVLLSNLFLILALDKTLTLYNQNRVFNLCFQTGFLVAVAAHFYLPSVLMLFLFFIALLVIRTFVWRDWVITIMGFLVPFMYSWVYYFWMNTLPDYYAAILSFATFFQNGGEAFNWAIINKLVFALLAIVGTVSLYRQSTHATVRHKNLLTIILFYFGLVLFGLFLSAMDLNALFLMSLIPLSIMISILLQSLKKKWMTEMTFLILLALALSSLLTAYS